LICVDVCDVVKCGGVVSRTSDYKNGVRNNRYYTGDDDWMSDEEWY
jgi:uncharacterized protein YceK